ncbi:MAG: DNA internalization-related competence protein ComEC/Rec2 [Candidatus Acidiferrales bacterium]
MKLPALWIAAAFATGIGLASRWPERPAFCAAVAALAILAGGFFILRQHLAAGAVCALTAWIALGGLALGIESAAVPANHVTRLIAANRLDLTEPLRWRGRLREDPLAMPWGRRYEIDLEQVESAGQVLPLSGGLRANLYGGAQQAAGLPENLRAGDRVEALVRARPPRNFLDPGAFDVHGYLARQKIDLIGSLRSSELLVLVDRPSPTLLQRLARARGNLLARLDALFADQPDRLAVLRAMLLGDRTFVDAEIVTAFQKTAAYHVLVVAGLHVGALAVFFFWLGRRLRFSAAAASLVTFLALAAYVGMVQDRPPILRAALMVALYLCARPFFRRVELLNTIALAALILLFWKPSSLADSSFELSFLAAGVIAGLAVPWMDRTSAPYRAGLAHLGDVTRDIVHSPKVIQFRIEMRAAANWLAARLPLRLAAHSAALLNVPIRAGLRLWEIVLLSAVIQWGMMPMLAQDFHRVSLAGPLSNIPAVILTGLIVPLGFLTLAATFVWARLSLLLARALGLLASALLGIVKWVSTWPRASYRIPGPPLWLMATFFLALICLAVAARAAAALRANRLARRQFAPAIRPAEWVSAFVLAALTLLVATHPFAPALERGKLEVNVLDVGQGDSIFAAFPDGRTMLIDGGGQPGSEWVGGHRSGIDVGEQVVSPYLWSRGIQRLDVVALTHAHHDHLDGLFSVLQNFRVRELWIGRDEETTAFKALLAEAHAQHIRIVREVNGSQFNWGGVRGDVLWPADPTPVSEASNDDSLVVRLEDGSVRFLLPGDIQKKVEQQLVAEHADIAADFLKVPHHGSKTSSTPDFVAAVAPKIAVVSAGEANPFGHPAESTVERYAQAGVRLLRTDRDGAVTALTDGHTLTVTTYTESHRN